MSGPPVCVCMQADHRHAAYTVWSQQIVSEVYLLSHLRGKKHQAALSSGDHSPSNSELAGADSVIVDAAEEHQGSVPEQPDIQQRIQAGKKKARKLRQRMGNR